MATFYLLPTRAELARHWKDHVRQWFPGLEDPENELIEQIIALVHRRSNAFTVFADDLAAASDPRDTLCATFGAEPDDRVFDLRAGPMPSLTDWAAGRINIFATTPAIAS